MKLEIHKDDDTERIEQQSYQTLAYPDLPERYNRRRVNIKR